MTSNNRFDCGGDPDHDTDPGIFKKEFLPLRDRDNCRNFVESAAPAEICGLRAFLVMHNFREGR